MAIELNGSGARTTIVIGGFYNLAAPWANPLCSLVELTAEISITPDSPLKAGASAGGTGMLFSNWNGVLGQSTFRLYFSANKIFFEVTDGTNIRGGSCPSPDTVGGSIWRIIGRWAGSGDHLAIDINGISQTVTLEVGAGFGPITALTANTGQNLAPIEIGYQTLTAAEKLNGAYAEAALLSAYQSDSETLKYGQGFGPHLLHVHKRLKYVKLTSANATAANPFDGEAHGLIVGPSAPVPAYTFSDEWSGLPYGALQILYSGTLSYYDGVFGSWSNVAHPAVTYSMSNPASDYAQLPQRKFTQDELLRTPAGLGSRSGRIFHVPSGTISDPHGGPTTFSPPTLQNAMNLAQNWYVNGGDDIAIDHTRLLQEDIIIPDVSGKTAPPVGTDWSYIHVYSDALSSLPTPAIRNITMPDSSLYPVLHENARIDRTNIARYGPFMPTIQGVVSQTGVFDTLDNQVRYWYFSGLHILQNPKQTYETGVLCNIASNTIDQKTLGYGPPNSESDHVLFSQCYGEGDPLKTGISCSGLMTAVGQFIGFIFGSCVDCYGFLSAEIQVITAAGAGPHHFEMNYLESLYAAGVFSGGNIEFRVTNIPSDMIYRRNYQVNPLKWRCSELTPNQFPGWVVNVTSAFGNIGVNYVSGPFDFNGNGNGYQPYAGGYMYEPATGKARQIFDDSIITETGATIYLTNGWPGGPQNGITVFFQSPDCLYNSGVNWPLGLATTDGSATVHLTEPLPAQFQLGTDPIYFYQNDNNWSSAGTIQYTLTESFAGFADTPVRRQQIIAISSDRKTLTLANPYNHAATLQYSLAYFDGMVRHQVQHQKSNFELKEAGRVLIEGCVFNVQGGERQHPTDEGFAVALSNVTITPTRATWTNPIPLFFVGMEQPFKIYGKPFPYFVLDNGGYSFSASVLVDTLDANGLGCSLVPGTNTALAGVAPIATGGPTFLMYVMPWPTATERVWRYNYYDSCFPPSMYSGAENELEGTKAQHLHFHDNLMTRTLQRHYYGHPALTALAANLPTGNTFRDNSGNIVWGAWLDESNSTWHFHHVTVVRSIEGPASPQGANVFNAQGPLNTPALPYDRSTDVVLDDMIVDGLDPVASGSPPAQGSVILGPTNAAKYGSSIDPTVQWTAPYSVKRGVFIGGQAAVAVADALFAPLFPDNVGLASRALAGFVNSEVPLSPWSPPADPGNFALQDLYTAGSVTVLANQTAVTFSGPLPANIVAGQFLAIRGAVGPPVRLQSVNNAAGTGVLVSAYSAVTTYTNAAFAVTFKGTGTDGLDPGANIPLLSAFIQGVVPGGSQPSQPPPTAFAASGVALAFY